MGEIMEKDIVEGNIGSVGKYDVAFKGGKLVLSLDAGADGVVGALSVSVDAAVVLDALAAAIPGKIDDAIIGLIKAALAA
jgi:hypothetical protein